MAENRMTQAIYQLKNEFVSHTGALGRHVEKLVAEKWINDIEAAVDSVPKDYPDTDCENDLDAFAEYSRRLEESHYPSVAMAVHSLAIGGGEIFPIHLANCLWELGVPVILMGCGMRPEDPKIRGLIGKDVPVLKLNSYAQLPGAVRKYGISVIHSHHAMIDLAVSHAISSGKIKAHQVITLHGMYEALDRPRREMLVSRVSRTADCFAYIADKNLKPFIDAGIRIDDRFVKLPNGLPQGSSDPVSRKELGIEENAFVLCLVSRALWEKGWKEAIDSVKLANEIMVGSRPVHLILVGDGEVYEKLKEEKDPHIHFAGAQQDTRRYLSAADMGFLPSRYSGESFPLALIDSFMCSKPVIASRLGEIPSMVRTDHGPAGYLFDLTEAGAIPVKRIAGAIVKIATDPSIYRKMCRCADEAAERYDIRHVAEKYLEQYRLAASRMPSSGHRSNPQDRANRPDVKILISCHKPSAALHSEVFQPIQVGAALSEERFSGMLHDDEGENISALNRSYCELTAQYWAWKNVKADYVGFFHYRRYLNLSDKLYKEDKYGNVYEPFLPEAGRLQEKIRARYGWIDETVRGLMGHYDVVTIEKRLAGDSDSSQTVRQQYAAAPYLQEKDLDCVLDIIRERHPDDYSYVEAYMEGTDAYYCNMYICRRDIFDRYCQWLFSILEEFCRRTDLGGYDDQQIRTVGHLGERLWGAYFSELKKRGQYRTRETQCVVLSHTDEGKVSPLMPVIGGVEKLLHVW